MGGKRNAQEIESHQRKRQKLDTVSTADIETIHNARQLQQLLLFQQDALPRLRNGIKAFKVFLESILYVSDKSSISTQQAILKEYLESQSSKGAQDNEGLFLSSLMQTWSFAGQANHDSLLSAVPAILALLLKTISTSIEFRNYGIQLCKTVLEQAQLRSIAKSLSASTHKEHVISPCLRLLTEVVSFDGGTMAKQVYLARAFTFDGKIVSRNLSLWKPASGDPDVDKRKPSVRSNTVRYLLANFKFQSSSTKAEMLKYGSIFRSLFDHVRQDTSGMLKEIFDTIKNSIILDNAIPQKNKGNIFDERNLSRLASIYRQDQSSALISSQVLSSDSPVHEFLKFVCTHPTAGLLRSLAGWYPPGTEKSDAQVEPERGDYVIDLGLASVEWYNRFQSQIPVRNTTLANFVQTLRPYRSLLENELLLTIFRAAPELVADYFFKKTFAFDPKLTATWIGYSAFLFTTIQLPIPRFFGREEGYGRVPPPISIVLENILPQPLSQWVITKCLNQQCELITFFAIRLTIVAFQKLEACLTCFREAANKQGTLWEEGAANLLKEFSLRCPKMNDVIAAFKKTSTEQKMQREAVLRLLKMYYQIIPQVALEKRFDISIALTDALKQLEDQNLPCEMKTAPASSEDACSKSEVSSITMVDVQMEQLNHLFQIAHRTPDMRWWHKPQSLKYSPVMTLLKFVVQKPREKILAEMQNLLLHITLEHDIFQKQTVVSTLTLLVDSLSTTDNYVASNDLFAFLDDVFGRLVKRSIKYLDDLDILMEGIENSGPISLFWMTVLEQWPFSVSKLSIDDIRWCGTFIACCKDIGEDATLLGKVFEKIVILTADETRRKALRTGRTQGLKNLTQPLGALARRDSEPVAENCGMPTSTIDLPSTAPPTEDEKHTGLHQWSTKQPREAIDDGDVSALILCLSSEYIEVRRQALTNLTKFMLQLDTDTVKANYPDAQQIYLLLGILTTTAAPTILTDQDPIPYLCTTYASLALPILTDPIHPLYEKLCRFHLKSPKWDIPHLASYWTHTLLRTPPSSTSTSSPPTHLTSSRPSPSTKTATTANSNYTEISWLLTYLHASLRTPSDMELLRQRSTFEPLLALSHDPFLPRDVAEQVVRLVWRATWIAGASTTLITRQGVVAWVVGQVAVCSGGDGAAAAGGGSAASGVAFTSQKGLRALARRLWETCDREYVERWSGGTMEAMVGMITEDDESGGLGVGL